MENKKDSVAQNKVVKAPEILAAETLIALLTNDTVEDAAKSLGIHRTAVYKRVRKYDLANKLIELKGSAQAELATGAAKAARNLISKIDSENEDTSVKASTEVLDRIGLTKPTGAGTAVQVNFNQHVTDKREEYGI